MHRNVFLAMLWFWLIKNVKNIIFLFVCFEGVFIERSSDRWVCISASDICSHVCCVVIVVVCVLWQSVCSWRTALRDERFSEQNAALCLIKSLSWFLLFCQMKQPEMGHCAIRLWRWKSSYWLNTSWRESASSQLLLCCSQVCLQVFQLLPGQVALMVYSKGSANMSLRDILEFLMSVILGEVGACGHNCIFEKKKLKWLYLAV